MKNNCLPIKSAPTAVLALKELRQTRAGNGIHSGIFKAALALTHQMRSDEEIFRAISDATSGCGREVPDREIYEAIQSARELKSHAPGARRWSAWPSVDRQFREKVIEASSVALDSLRAHSPIPVDHLNPEAIVDALFPGNPLICVGWSTGFFSTNLRENLRGQLAKCQFIVPSPMSAVQGTTKSGRLSAHCLDNTGPRRFAVVEFDSGSCDLHAALLWHLKEKFKLPLAMVVHSGGKSLHGWIYCEGAPEVAIKAFYQYSVILGADKATFVKSQFVRMPQGVRANGALQKVHYFNPAAAEGSCR